MNRIARCVPPVVMALKISNCLVTFNRCFLSFVKVTNVTFVYLKGLLLFGVKMDLS